MDPQFYLGFVIAVMTWLGVLFGQFPLRFALPVVVIGLALIGSPWRLTTTAAEAQVPAVHITLTLN